MDIKEIKEALDVYLAVINQDDWTGQLYQDALLLLSKVERLEKDVEGLSENLFISNEYAVKLEKENAALSEAIKTMEEMEDEFQERINGVSWNGDE